MCVTSHNFKCCCGCMSMTTATIILGSLYLFGAICNAIVGNWIGFGGDLLLTGVFSLVIFKPHSVGIRKCIFWMMTTLQSIGILGFTVLVICGIVIDWEENLCNDYWSDMSQYFESETLCEEQLRQVFIMVIVLSILIGLPLIFCILQILYYGYKEQEHFHRERLLANVTNFANNTNIYQPVAVAQDNHNGTP